MGVGGSIKWFCGGQFLVFGNSDKVTVSQHLGAENTFRLYDFFKIYIGHRVVTEMYIARILVAQKFPKDGRVPKCDYFSISEDQKMGSAE